MGQRIIQAEFDKKIIELGKKIIQKIIDFHNKTEELVDTNSRS